MPVDLTFKPHRGRTSIMSNDKKNIVLDIGELFVEMPDEVTGNNQYKIKIGDGITTYENLPYAVDPSNINIDTSTISTDTSTNMSTTRKDDVLSEGELFLEKPDNLTGDNQYKIKIGDGVTTYENLPYAVDPTNISSGGSGGTANEYKNVIYDTNDMIVISNGVTFTKNALDGSIALSGENDTEDPDPADSIYYFFGTTATTYVPNLYVGMTLTGLPEDIDNDDSFFRISYYDTSGTFVKSEDLNSTTGDSYIIEDYPNIRLTIQVHANTDTTDLVFYPMIRPTPSTTEYVKPAYLSKLTGNLSESVDSLKTLINSPATVVETVGTASNTTISYQRLKINNGTYVTIPGTKYMQHTITLSTSSSVTCTFTNADITTDSVIEVFTSLGLNYKSMTVSNGTCSIVFDYYSSASSMSVRIYIK